LMYYPLMFLVGFVFLSAFLGKFAETIHAIVNGRRKTLVESLLNQLTTTDMVGEVPTLQDAANAVLSEVDNSRRK
jgi:hypothetical protein